MSLNREIDRYMSSRSANFGKENSENGSDDSEKEFFVELFEDNDVIKGLTEEGSAVTSNRLFGNLQNHDEITAEIMNRFAEVDKDKYKTFARIVVEKYLSKYKWYYSPMDSPDAPSLSKAWAFYEHVTLARYFEGEGEHKFAMAEPGECDKDTKLYSPVRTPSSALSEWGIGVAMYFSSVSKIGFLLLIAGVISLANAIYFGSPDYGGNYRSSYLVLRGSAVCLRTGWVYCANCEKEEWLDRTKAYATYTGADNTTHTFVQHNLCEGAQMSQAMVTFGTLAFLIICFWLLDWYNRKLEVRFDESWITASDYSVWVKNPPPDANDPDEWKNFFKQFAEKQVSCCTVALNNQELMRALTRRKVLKYDLLDLLEDRNVDLDNEDEARNAVAKYRERKQNQKRSFFRRCFSCTILPLLRLLKLAHPTAELILDEIFFLKEEIMKLEKKKYDAISVFITFETEKGQRTALQSLSISLFDMFRNDSSSMDPSFLFRDEHILSVCEAPEPSSVRWMELNYCQQYHILLIQRFITFSITVGLAIVSGYTVREVRQEFGPFASAILLSFSNFLIPIAVKIMLAFFEKHTTDDTYQQSLYLKVALFRWTNTVFLTFVISEDTTALGDDNVDLLRTVSFVFVSELFVTPLLQILDFGGLFRKHILAPRAETQQRMNYAFTGTYYNIGERYTDLTKILSLAVFYNSLMPTSLIYGALILFVQYYSDKYCLMRVWSRAPFVGPTIARFSRRYFFNFALVSSVAMATYIYSMFPFDNVCVKNIQNSTVPTGLFPVKFLDTTSGSIQVTGTKEYVFCDIENSILDHLPNPFFSHAQPADSKWMTESQESTSEFFAIFLCVFAGFLFLTVLGPLLYTSIKSLFTPTYEAENKDQMLDFTNRIDGMMAYIPQIKAERFTFPLLVCDIDDVDVSLVGWNPHPSSYDEYNLIFECFEAKKRRAVKTSIKRKRGSTIGKTIADLISNENDAKTPPGHKIFSTVKHWQPDWVMQDFEDSPNISMN